MRTDFFFFPQILTVIYLQAEGRKFPLELKCHQATVGQNPSETIISRAPKIMGSLRIILLCKVYTKNIFNFILNTRALLRTTEWWQK